MNATAQQTDAQIQQQPNPSTPPVLNAAQRVMWALEEQRNRALSELAMMTAEKDELAARLDAAVARITELEGAKATAAVNQARAFKRGNRR